MSSARGAAIHVGRIGTLAVALGIGAAVAGGTGVAWADGTAGSRGAEGTANAEQTSTGASAQTAATESNTPARRGTRGPRAAATAAERPRADGPAAGAARRNSVTLPAVAAPDPVSVPDVRATNDSPAVTASAAKAVVPQAIVRIAEPTVPLVTAALSPVPAAAAVPSTPAPTAALVSVPVLAAPVAVVAEAAPITQTVAAPPRTLMSRLLAAVGLSALGAGSAPSAPAANPALWGLMAWTRRESSRTLVRSAASTLQSAAVTTSAVTNLPTQRIAWVTGQSNTAIPGLGWPQTNNTQWAGVYGTDLGIMWFNGVNNKTQLAFGDTFSGPNMTGDWRSNVLLLSEDTQLYNGLSLINTGYAYQFIPAARNQVFFIGSEVTNIPTAAVFVPTGPTDPQTGLTPGENYVNYMSVKSWDSPGRWTTNYSAISKFDPSTDKWVLQTSTVRSAGWFRSSTPYRAGDQNFQQMAYVLQPESDVVDGQPRYVYAFGTPSGRQGSAYLSRVPEGAITDLNQYEYWDGAGWVRGKPAVATEVIGTSKSSGLFGFVKDLANNPNFFGGWFAGLFGPKTGGNVSEMSVQYNEYLGKYVVMYGDGLNNIQLRTADTPEGPWSDPIQVASSIQYPGLYAPFIHPLSGTGELTDANGDPDVSNLYWNMSLWGNYNVVLMKTDLAPLNPVLV